MFILVDKVNQKVYASKSKKEIARITGLNYHTLSYYFRKGYFESEYVILSKVEVLKSKQGGYRGEIKR